MEWIAIIVASIIAALAYLEGRKAGQDSAQRDHVDAVLEAEEDQADVELEAELNKPIADRLRALRERILGRRGNG